jgi:hypothetical protein
MASSALQPDNVTRALAWSPAGDVLAIGDDGGWGSGPASTGSGLCEQGGQQLITDFQQHPPPFGGDRFEETAADMFLNWVYSAFSSNTWDIGQVRNFL